MLTGMWQVVTTECGGVELKIAQFMIEKGISPNGGAQKSSKIADGVKRNWEKRRGCIGTHCQYYGTCTR